MGKEEKSLLIVEDEKDIAEAIGDLLEDIFGQIHYAETVEKAKSLLYQYDYALILLDINLQGRNGVEILKFLVDNPLNANNRASFVLMSGIINDEFIKKHSTKFSALLPKPFEPNVLRNKVIEIVGLPESTPKAVIKKSDLDEIPIVAVNGPLPVGDIQRDVLKYLALAKKKTKVKNLLTKLNIDRDVGKYYLSHIGLVINCAMAISSKMDWHNEKTIEKYVYAAYLHDVSLSKHPEISKYKTMGEIDSDQWELGLERYTLVVEHAEASYKLVQGLEDLPQDVDTMIRMHHELPNGTGFPFKSDHKKMNPAVSVFIAAHDLADYIYGNESWDLKIFIKSREAIYLGNNFQKILKALYEISKDLEKS